MSEELALLWARRSERFLAEAIKDHSKNGANVSLDGISFVDYEDNQPKIKWKKLISLYEVERLVPLQIKIHHSIDESTVPEIFAALRGVLGDIQIVVSRASEGCTEITVLVPRQNADETVALFNKQDSLGDVLEVKERPMRPRGSIARRLVLDGPVIDLGKPDALDRFEKVWRKVVWIESVIRPWRRLRWLASPSLHSSPIARVIRDSNDRAYAADLRSRREAFKADVRMTSITWPLFAAVSLTMGLLALRPFFPFIAVSAGVATGLALSLAGAQVCASALSPIACGAGTVVMCWAFGLAQAFAVGAFRSGGVLSRASIHNDFFISVTGGIVGLSAPSWLSQMPFPVVIVLPITIASAIAASGWFMTQPANADPVPEKHRRRIVLGGIAGAGMGAGIGIVRLITTVLNHLGFPQHVAFIVAFTLTGSATFAFTIQLRRPRLRKNKLVPFALSHAFITSALCSLAYRNAGDGLGLLALAASSGWYHATWFTAASIVGNRIGSARAAVIATTLEGALGFTAFVVFRLLQG